MRKLLGKRGETLTETLAAILIAAMACMMLLTAVSVSTKLNLSARRADEALRLSQEEAELRKSAGEETSVTVALGADSSGYPVVRYGSEDAVTAYAFKEMP